MKNGGTRENPDIVGAGPNDVHVSVGFFWTQNMFWSENILRFGLPLNFGFELIANTKLSTWTQTTPFCLSIFASASRIQEEMLLWWPEIHGLPLSCRHADDGRQHPISSTPRRGAFALCKPLDPALLRGVCVVRRPTVGACAFFGAFSSPSFVV